MAQDSAHNFGSVAVVYDTLAVTDVCFNIQVARTNTALAVLAFKQIQKLGVIYFISLIEVVTSATKSSSAQKLSFWPVVFAAIANPCLCHSRTLSVTSQSPDNTRCFA